VTELRQCRLALSKLLFDLRLPVEVGEDGTDAAPAASVASIRASRAAERRWANERARREAKGLPPSNREVRRRGPS
jgi:hypothetical protein